MKAQLIGAALLAAILAGCGGKASFVVGGSVSGLNNQGLVLQDNGGSDLPVAAGATSFSFPNSISYGTEYKVSIKSQPEHMTCQVLNPTGSAGHTTVINIVVSCSQNSYSLGGTITGLKLDGLVLVNGASGSVTLTKTATSFTMPGTIPVGTPYGVSVLTQPSQTDATSGVTTTQTCAIVQGTGSGIMGDANVNNIQVNCAP